MKSQDPVLRIAHISDLHFAKPTFDPLQFFSKRWLGNLNLLFLRQRQFDTSRLFPLIEDFKKRGVQYVIVSGDLTTTSHKKEFKEAAAFLNELQKAGIHVLTLPGNHDHYTKSAYKKRLFYQYFPCTFSHEEHPSFKYNLKEHGLTIRSLGYHWWFIALDTALSTSLISSRGLFSSELEKKLEEVLSHIPKDDHVIIANHFPFFDNDHPRKILVRGSALREMIQRFSQVKLYLHGHTHRQCLADLRPSNLPIVLDSGSTPHDNGAWNLLEIRDNNCKVDVFKWKDTEWQTTQQTSFNWKI